MSQYYYLKVGGIHEEDYKEWIETCKKLKAVGLLDEWVHVIELSWIADDDDPHTLIMEAIRDGKDYQQYVPEGY